jgi:hypothetical protein
MEGLQLAYQRYKSDDNFCQHLIENPQVCSDTLIELLSKRTDSIRITTVKMLGLVSSTDDHSDFDLNRLIELVKESAKVLTKLLEKNFNNDKVSLPNLISICQRLRSLREDEFKKKLLFHSSLWALLDTCKKIVIKSKDVVEQKVENYILEYLTSNCDVKKYYNQMLTVMETLLAEQNTDLRANNYQFLAAAVAVEASHRLIKEN